MSEGTGVEYLYHQGRGKDGPIQWSITKNNTEDAGNYSVTIMLRQRLWADGEGPEQQEICIRITQSDAELLCQHTGVVTHA